MALSMLSCWQTTMCRITAKRTARSTTPSRHSPRRTKWTSTLLDEVLLCALPVETPCSTLGHGLWWLLRNRPSDHGGGGLRVAWHSCCSLRYPIVFEHVGGKYLPHDLILKIPIPTCTVGWVAWARRSCARTLRLYGPLGMLAHSW